jgi:ubiquinone/menaquinone biosynthesis C-methylase UbiE
LIAYTDNDAMLSVARRSAGSENYCGANGESMPFKDFEFSHVDLTRA